MKNNSNLNYWFVNFSFLKIVKAISMMYHRNMQCRINSILKKVRNLKLHRMRRALMARMAVRKLTSLTTQQYATYQSKTSHNTLNWRCKTFCLSICFVIRSLLSVRMRSQIRKLKRLLNMWSLNRARKQYRPVQTNLYKLVLTSTHSI